MRLCRQVESIAGVRFKYYFSSTVTVVVTGGVVRVTSPFTGVLRVAVLRAAAVPTLAYDTATAAQIEALYDTYSGESSHARRQPSQPPHPTTPPCLCRSLLPPGPSA
jgi:hypothetical protein